MDTQRVVDRRVKEDRMRTRTCSWGIGTAVSVGLAVMAGAVSVHAQESAQGPETVRAIKELTGEIRSLRTAIEHGAESQLQGQILGLYLNLQQNRVTQATARLDEVRRELEGVMARAREMAQEATSLEARLAEETDATKRRDIERAQVGTKQESERAAAQEQRVRNRETEVYQALQTEEARWTELISRLEQLLKK
jgi:hypothetical protein